jgi:hypothetical protein
MGHAELRTSEFSRNLAADQLGSSQVAALFPPKPIFIDEPASDADPKARRVAALVFLGGVVAFWGGTAAIVSAYFF